MLRRARPFLFVVMEADRPLAGGARLSLDGLSEIAVGRGERGVALDPRNSRRATLRLPSRAVSASHARFHRMDEGWVIEDTRSTNGVYVNGVRCTRAALASGDLVEIGRTFLSLSEHEAPAEGPRFFETSGLTSSSPGMLTLLPATAARLEALSRVAASSIPVLLSGETGTGKEVLARALHEMSARSGPFIAVNCATLTENLGASQLFGHVRGAFSGAASDTPGFVRAAHGGTLLLDEVQELALPSQAMLLRVLQEQEVVPVGGVRPVRVDVRVIATSPYPLEQAVRRGSFRPDVFARLSGFSHRLEPLSERLEDLGLLVAALLGKHGVSAADRPRFAPSLVERMLRHPWPLNVRELEQLLRRAWLFARDGSMEAGDLLDDPETEEPTPKAPRALSEEERALRERLLSELTAGRGNVALVARNLGKAPVQIRRWLKRFAIDADSFR